MKVDFSEPGGETSFSLDMEYIPKLNEEVSVHRSFVSDEYFKGRYKKTIKDENGDFVRREYYTQKEMEKYFMWNNEDFIFCKVVDVDHIITKEGQQILIGFEPITFGEPPA